MGDIEREPSRRPELDSWKAVAGYLGVSIRTAQYWETRLNLPVRRLPGTKGRILADPEELDAWKRQQPEAGDSPTSDLSTITLAKHIRWNTVGLLSGFGAVLVCLTTFIYLHNRPGPFVSAHLADGDLVALNKEGREVWRRSFNPPASGPAYSVGSPRRDFIWTGDLDGDGRQEVLFAANLEAERPGDLICFDSEGEERWRYRPHFQPRIRGRELRDVWLASGLAVGPRRGGRTGIWVTFLNASSSPALVIRLSPTGTEEARYCHSGHLHILKLWERIAGEPAVLVAAGINNRLKRATLIVLDPETLSGVSSEPDDPEEQLLGSSSGSELFRVFFATTQLGQVAAKYNSVRAVETAGGQLMVETDENLLEPGYALVRYELSNDLTLRNVQFHDTFPTVHAQFLARGLLKREFSESETEVLRRSYRVVGKGVSPTRESIEGSR